MNLAEKTKHSNRDHLKRYSAHGFRLFPLKEDKTPQITGWQKKATSDLFELLTDKELFGSKFEDNQIGALTGYEFFVVDGDDDEVEGMPLTPTARSETRGYHYYFRVPPGFIVPNITGLMPNVDIKGLGGLVVLPSENNDREWVHPLGEVEMADAPKWLLEKIRDHIESKTSYSSSGASGTYAFSY